MLLKYDFDPVQLQEQLQYALDMGLNTMRFEGKTGRPDLLRSRGPVRNLADVRAVLLYFMGTMEDLEHRKSDRGKLVP